MHTILLVILIALLIGALPTWHVYGYWPSGGLGLVLLILIILMIVGRA